jgi:hypothetical protein
VKIQNTGAHIPKTSASGMFIQQSYSQANALAFQDIDGTWIHIDKDMVMELSKYVSPQVFKGPMDYKMSTPNG